VVVIGGYFLSWIPASNPPPGTTLYISEWNDVNYYLTGASLPGGTPSAQQTSTAPFVALLLALPVLLALVAIVAAGIGLLRGLGPVLASLIAAAGVMGILSSGVTGGLNILVLARGSANGTSLLGLGLAVTQVGLFAMLAGGFMAALQVRRATG
jgi:hypothetical protein